MHALSIIIMQCFRNTRGTGGYENIKPSPIPKRNSVRGSLQCDWAWGKWEISGREGGVALPSWASLVTPLPHTWPSLPSLAPSARPPAVACPRSVRPSSRPFPGPPPPQPRVLISLFSQAESAQPSQRASNSSSSRTALSRLPCT